MDYTHYLGLIRNTGSPVDPEGSWLCIRGQAVTADGRLEETRPSHNHYYCGFSLISLLPLRLSACLRAESLPEVMEEQWGLVKATLTLLLPFFLSFFLSPAVLVPKLLPISLPFHLPPHPQMGWLRSAPSWRRSSARRTWNSGWPVRSSRRPGQLQN